MSETRFAVLRSRYERFVRPFKLISPAAVTSVSGQCEFREFVQAPEMNQASVRNLGFVEAEYGEIVRPFKCTSPESVILVWETSEFQRLVRPLRCASPESEIGV